MKIPASLRPASRGPRTFACLRRRRRTLLPLPLPPPPQSRSRRRGRYLFLFLLPSLSSLPRPHITGGCAGSHAPSRLRPYCRLPIAHSLPITPSLALSRVLYPSYRFGRRGLRYAGSVDVDAVATTGYRWMGFAAASYIPRRASVSPKPPPPRSRQRRPDPDSRRALCLCPAFSPRPRPTFRAPRRARRRHHPPRPSHPAPCIWHPAPRHAASYVLRPVVCGRG
ncbi:hypothetical protein B0H11DRAFT_2228998 [Mycena galericulata]|nr:hypothetical protein B0H11DRAFT_2228998 [Mycena galericulata]